MVTMVACQHCMIDLSFNAVAMNSRDQYEIIDLRAKFHYYFILYYCVNFACKDYT